MAGAILAWAALAVKAGPLAPLGPEPTVPAFSISYMDRSISPGTNFYSFANGQWVKDNPVPADKAAWGGQAQLEQRNSYLIHALLEDAAAGHNAKGTPRRQVSDFYAAAMDTNRLEQLRFKPIAADLIRPLPASSIIDQMKENPSPSSRRRAALAVKARLERRP